MAEAYGWGGDGDNKVEKCGRIPENLEAKLSSTRGGRHFRDVGGIGHE
jgi:hypothetical protein